MKILYYYVKWLLSQYKYESIHVFFLGAIINIVGLSMNFLSVALIHTRYDEHGVIQFYKDEYWAIIGDKFLTVGTVIVVISAVVEFIVKPIRKSFNRFKQARRELFSTIDKGY